MSIRVPFTDLGAQHMPLADEIIACVRRVIGSSRFVLGSEVEQFERDVASLLGVRNAIGVSSGTDALLVALLALGIGPGDEVITTPFTFIATAEAILRAGARPRFVDVDPRTLNIDVSRLDEAVTARARAIVPVHLYGSPVDMDALREAAARLNVPIIEDAAQSFVARHGARAAGTWGVLGCFSFFPAKVLGALGDAGLVVTDDDALALRCRRLRQHGSHSPGEHVELGGNFRMDALQAAVLSVKLPRVEEWVRARRAHGAAYDAAFRDVPGLAPVRREPGWNGAVYTVRVADGRRDACRASLAEAGVDTAVYYPRPLHRERALVGRYEGHDSFPECERAAGEVLSLPIHAEMTETQRAHVIDEARAFFEAT